MAAGARSLARWLSRRTRWQWGLAAVIALWTTYFTKVTLDVHHGLGTSSYDFGLYDQGVWLMSRFQAPFVTLMGRNLMGDHASFILVFLAPFYWLFPSAGTLFFFQSLGIGMGALPVFLYARKRLESEGIALALAICYLLHPAVGWTNRENFHPDAFLGFFVGMAIYGALERKWRVYVVFLVLSLLVKEDASLVLVPLGVWVGVRRSWRYGVATIIASLTFMVFAMFVVMRSLIGVPTRNGWRIPFGGPKGLIEEAISRPGNVIQHFRSEDRPFYFWQMTFPVAWVFARAPSVALISLVVLGTNMLSTFFYQYHIEYHYSLVAVPAIVIGTVYAIGFIERHRRWVVAGVAFTSLWSCLMWGVVPVGRILTLNSDDPIGRAAPPYWEPDYPSPVAARELFPVIPAGAAVSAYHALDPHLTHRTHIYQFPNPWRVVLYGPNTDLENIRACLAEANDIDYVMLPSSLDDQQQADWDIISADFSVAASNDYWVVYERTGHSVRCVVPPGQEGGVLVRDPAG